MDLSAFFDEIQERIIKSCIRCGKCVSQCKIMQLFPCEESPQTIQRDIVSYLRGDAPLSEAANKKVGSCMRCYGCVGIDCPIGADSLTINELVLRRTNENVHPPCEEEMYTFHRERAKEFTTPEEYVRITTPVWKYDSEYAFFSGCNVFKQPDKLLNALDILEAIGNEYTYIPGIEYCCGISLRGISGDADWMQSAGQKLMSAVEQARAKTLVLWCPTCACAVEHRIKKYYEPKFEIITFGQYILRYLDRLEFRNDVSQVVTYHEPCKAAYMKVDTDSVRELLTTIPNTVLVEMEHHGDDAMCCGCRAAELRPEIGNTVTERRIQEAVATGAETMIDVCHNCHWLFSNYQKETGRKEVKLVNYSTYIAKALGISREDSMTEGDQQNN